MLIDGRFPLPAPPQRVPKKGAFIIYLRENSVTGKNLSLGFSEYGMTNASNISWGLPPASNPKG